MTAGRRDGHPGCWCDADGADPRKIGALGLRIERGVSYHGIALNVTVDLADFDLIDPCGMPGVTSTSIARELGDTGAAPTTSSVERAGRHLRHGLRRRAGRPPGGVLSGWPPACSSSARTPSPAGGWPRSSTAPSTATGSRAPPSRSTTVSSAAPTAPPRTATGSASGCSRTSRSTSWAPVTTPGSSIAASARSRWRRPARPAAGGRSSRRPKSTGRSMRSATT